MDRELDLRLKEIRNRISHVDPLLAQLIIYATDISIRIQYGLALVLDGVTVMGIPARSASTAETLDNRSVRYYRSLQAMDMSTGSGPGTWPEVIEAYQDTAPFVSRAQKDDEARSGIFNKIGNFQFNDVTELLEHPDNLADEAVGAFAPLKAITLLNAQVRPIGGTTWESVPNIRVNLSAVNAWWTFDLDIPEEAREILARLESDAEESLQEK